MNNLRLIIVVVLNLSFSVLDAGVDKPTSFQLPKGINAQDYLPKTVVIKVKDAYRSSCHVNSIEIPELQSIFQSIKVSSVAKVFPNHHPPATRFNKDGFKYADLSLIFTVEYTADAELVKVINSLIRTDLLEYAEPKYLPHLCFTPNDSLIGGQGYLNLIKAFGAWDISKGDTNVVIGIVDTGTDIDHPDLVPNLKLNYNDPINNIDDDNDGYVDNYNGWDLGENDNNPSVGTCGACLHGSHVTGCADAATNNTKGVASTGFKCRHLPVKIANANGTLSKAYEGITYAADHGCQIINCSWGGGGGGSFGQDVIDYATINKDALVVAAAGNTGTSGIFYPAAYNYVLSVAATNNNNDDKAGFSSFGTYVDVSAPGNAILATYFNNKYNSLSGTSMASPIVAGAAAIVKSYFPALNALQVGEQLRTTTDNIYSLPGNSLYVDSLGSGRINMLKSLTLSSPSVRIHPINITDNNDKTFITGDSLFITGDITNYLDSTTNLNLTLTTNSPYVTILDNNTFIGGLGTMKTTNNNGDPFIVLINPGVPVNSVIGFKILIQDGSYNDFQLFECTINVDYVNITINDVFTSNTSKGRLCYNGTGETEGLGFDFIHQGTLTYEAGFLAGSPLSVSDNIRGASGTDDDFLPLINIEKTDPGVWSDFDTYGLFNDANNPIPLGLNVSYRSYSWKSPPNARFHIFEYTMINTSGSSLTDLYAGIISDWDIQNAGSNKASVDVVNKMGYVWYTNTNGFYAGTKLLSASPFLHYAMDNVTGGSGGVDPTGGFTDAEKYAALSTNRANAGGTGTGNDVIDAVSTGPFNLNAGDSVTVAFALIAGSDIADLTNSAIAAQLQYDQITTAVEALNIGAGNVLVYPNPANNELSISFNKKETSWVHAEIKDLSGRIIADNSRFIQEKGNQSFIFNTSTLNEGLYLLEISTHKEKLVKKLVIVH